MRPGRNIGHLADMSARTWPKPGRLAAMTATHHIPAQLTTFVGRVEELHSIESALAEARLVTLVGPGGCGKTRLAAQVTGGREHSPDPTRWVDLTQTSDPTMVARLVADAAGILIAADQGGPASLARQIGEQRLLLVLDNCEHVLEAAAELVAALLRSCPRVQVLATSRESLGVPGERLWRVPSLAGDDAVALFNARATQPTTDEESAAVIRSACAKLDGIPLAVELAAAWSGALSPQEILRGIDDRFSLLVRGPRGVAARHQTLAASMAWSHDLLEDKDRTLFLRLGVFHGGFTLEAAQKVCGYGDLREADVPAGLGRLVDKSLLVADTRDARTRYRMLETVREYAVHRLTVAGEYDDVRTRQLDATLTMVRSMAPLLDEDLDAWRAHMNPDAENLRAAVEYGLTRQDPDAGRQLASELPFLWHLGSRGREGLALLHAAIEKGTGERTELQARLLIGLALVADTTQPYGLEYDTAQAALDIAREVGDRRTACMAVLLSGVGTFYTDLDAGLELAESALAEADEIGHRYVQDAAPALMGIIAHLRDEHDRAVPLLQRALSGLVPRAERGIASTAKGFLALSALFTGDVAGARKLAVEGVELARPLGDYHRIGSACSVLATVEGMAGRLDEAHAALDPILRLVEDAENPPFVPGFARAVGYLHLWAGRPEQAVEWYRREAPRQDLAADTYLSPPTLTALALALRQTGEVEAAAAACENALSVARKIGLPRVTADALEQSAQLARPHDRTRAEALHHEALALRAEHGLWLVCVDSIEAIAALAVQAESFTEAARLLGACDHARQSMGYPQLATDVDTTSRIEEALGDEAYGIAFNQGQLMTVPEATAYVQRARGSRGRPSSGWESLTPTERAVVRLAVEGLSNPQIGERLFMSRGTVKTHLSHVYAKLGVSNRTELAATAVKR